MKPVHLPCSLKVYERHSGAPSTFLLVALKDLPKNFKGPACVAVTLVVNHTLKKHSTLVVNMTDGSKRSFDTLFLSLVCKTLCIHKSFASTCVYVKQ